MRVKAAGLVMLAVPFSAIGAVWLFYLLGYNVSIAAWVGMIALLGLDAETAVFMRLFLDLSYDEAKRKGRLVSRRAADRLTYGSGSGDRPQAGTREPAGRLDLIPACSNPPRLWYRCAVNQRQPRACDDQFRRQEPPLVAWTAPVTGQRRGGSPWGGRRLAALSVTAGLVALFTPGVTFGQPAPPRKPAGELRWGGDAEGGSPFVEADPRDPTKLAGFDVEVAALLAEGLHLVPRFVQVAWPSIDASTLRGDFDIGMSGVEDTPARRARLLTTIPYFEFREVLTVRASDATRFTTLASLAKRRVGTLGATEAYEILLSAARQVGLEPVSYEDDVHPYTDLVEGRLDAVLLDHIIAARAERHTPGMVTQTRPVARGRYIGVLAPDQWELRDRVNAIMLDAMRDGRLERIYRKWNIWDAEQARFLAAMASGGAAVPGADPTAARPAGWFVTSRRYLPSLLEASLVTIALSCLAMALAVGVGIVVASGRVYGDRVMRSALTAYVEVTRGTPVLLQLFVLYYGLAAIVRLPAFVAALVGLGLNYAAYESEIYRGALMAVPAGQLEAARTLGLSELQVLRLIRGPQAFRLALAPMTNDFVALLKDSSLVSVITVIELTKQTSIIATNIGSWVLPGGMCALLYLAMSLPLAHLARRLERRWTAPLA